MADSEQWWNQPADAEGSGREGAGPNPQHFAPGNPGGPGRRPGPNLSTVINKQSDEKPGQVALQAARFALLHCGIQTHFPGEEAPEGPEGAPISQEIPEFETIRELFVWVYTVRAMAGSTKHASELYDRTDPKPQRVIMDTRVTAREAIKDTAPGTVDRWKAVMTRPSDDDMDDME